MRPSAWSRLTTSPFSSGSTSACTSSMPSFRATASAVVRLSPVSMTTRSPSSWSSSKRLRRRRLDRIGDPEQTRRPAVDGDEHHRLPVRAAAPPPAAASSPGVDARALRGAARCRAPRARPSTRAGRRPCPVQRLESSSAGSSASPRSSAPRDDRAASGCSLARSRLAASRSSSSSSTPGAATTDDQPRLALGERAGLVDDQRVDLLQDLQRLGVLDRARPPCAPRPVPTMIDIGVARPSAHGQAMISTATALTRA